MSRFIVEETEMDFGYQPVENGNYLIKFDEGMETCEYVDKKTGEPRTGLKIYLKIVDTIPGDNEGSRDSIGKTFDHFCAIDTSFGEKQICMIISNCGLGQKFAEKFDDSVSFTDTQFLTALKLSLPEKMMCVETINKKSKGKDGREFDNTNILKWWKNEKKKAVTNTDDAPSDW